MLKYTDYNIVFQEIPNEVTLAINISGCPNRCPGCHSPWLWEDIGKPLTEEVLSHILTKYEKAITCVCFMGGDAQPDEIAKSAVLAKEQYKLKTAWYSGKDLFPSELSPTSFNYIKLGPYIKELGPLKSKTTNQHLYHVGDDGSFTDITAKL